VSGFTKQYYSINRASMFQADFTDIVSTLHDIQEVEREAEHWTEPDRQRSRWNDRILELHTGVLISP
jgi:hypothetical protein